MMAATLPFGVSLNGRKWGDVDAVRGFIPHVGSVESLEPFLRLRIDH